MSTDYTQLVTNQHADKPNLIATIETLTGAMGLGGIIDTLASLPTKFDVDVAEGAQLDAVGLWVGASRFITAPLNYYFSWDTVGLGWDQASWKGPNDGTSGLTVLDDAVFRMVIKSLIAADHWDGTLKSYQDLMDAVLSASENSMYGVDNQNMSMNVVVTGPKLSAVLQAIISAGILGIKPAGVSIAGYVFPVKNLTRYSEQLDNAAWSKTRATVTADAVVAPDGNTTAERIVVDATAANSHYVHQSITGLLDNQRVSFSVYVQQDVADRAMLQFVTKAGATRDLEFKFDDQKMLRTTNGSDSSTVHSVHDDGGGWYRLQIAGIDVGSGATTPSARLIVGRNPTLADTTVWSRVGTTGASSGATPPVAGKRVAAFTEDSSGTFHYASSSISFVAGKTYQFDAWAQVLGSGSTRYLSLVLPGGTAWGVTQGATFDVSAGTVTFTTGSGANLQASITDAGGGWWLCRITATAVGTNSASVQVRLNNASNTTTASYAGDGASGLLICEPYVRCTDSSVGLGACAAGTNFDGDSAQSVYAWGFQLEWGSQVSEYEVRTA